ncbi:hypothetical protein Bbelb_431940 [Branchiostoma belcheri]|nr:hypothetical protein Bbelb_431940 [Branchiostoma belcheri]
MEKAKTRDVIAFSHNCAAPPQLRGRQRWIMASNTERGLGSNWPWRNARTKEPKTDREGNGRSTASRPMSKAICRSSLVLFGHLPVALVLPNASVMPGPSGAPKVPGLIYHKVLQAPSIHQAHATRGASVEDDLSQAVRSRQARCRSNLSQVILTHESRHASSGTEQPGATFQPVNHITIRIQFLLTIYREEHLENQMPSTAKMLQWPAGVERYGVEEHAGGLVSKSPKVQEAATCPWFHLQKVRQNILSVAVGAQANMKKDDLFRREGKTDSRVGIKTLRTHRLNIGAAITPQTPVLSLFASFHLYTF